MKVITFLFLILNFQNYAQITGNMNVLDDKALLLDSTIINQMIGKWKLVESVENINEELRKVNIGYIYHFRRDGTIIESRCWDCTTHEEGEWEIINERTVEIKYHQTDNKYLAGNWVLYLSTDIKMEMAKILTSTGNWKRILYFNKDISEPNLTEFTKHCTNCEDGSFGKWCWGVSHRGAQEHWTIFTDHLSFSEDSLKHSVVIKREIDWLLKYSPCINKSLYDRASSYYEKLINYEENKKVKKKYKSKLKFINDLRQHYFKE